jgi:hypothetical protein
MVESGADVKGSMLFAVKAGHRYCAEAEMPVNGGGGQ